jgi:hypothetical protein
MVSQSKANAIARTVSYITTDRSSGISSVSLFIEPIWDLRKWAKMGNKWDMQAA